MKEKHLNDEQRMFRDAVRAFVRREIAPHYEQWEADGVVPRSLWEAAGAQGFLCMDVGEAYGGGGAEDFRFNALVIEELARAGAFGVGFSVHNDMVVPYLVAYGDEAQKKRWLPRLASGEWVGAIAMTEPNTGSDLAAVETTAIRDGDSYLLNGQKTFISNGLLNDLVIVVARTMPGAGSRGISLLVVERGMEGYERGRNLDKMGLHAQDTAELFFRDVRLPLANRLGEANQGFLYLMRGLPRERLAIAIGAIAAAESVLAQTIEYCSQRRAFGQPLANFQNTRFRLAEMQTEVEIGRVFIDECIQLLNVGELSAERAAMAKWWTTDLQGRVVDLAVQLFGGYGYMREYPVARAYVDARAQRIYGGTNEIMKELIGRSLFKQRKQSGNTAYRDGETGG